MRAAGSWPGSWSFLGAISQGRSREEARENVLDALRTLLTPDEELAGEAPEADREHLRVRFRGVKRRDLERHLQDRAAAR